MNFTAACSTLGSPFRTHQTSPPSGTTGFPPSLGTGIVTIPKSTPLFLTFASCQGPITIVRARADKLVRNVALVPIDHVFGGVALLDPLHPKLQRGLSVL